MMADELNEIRHDAAIPSATNISARSWQSHVRDLLAHIAEQMVEIEYWKSGAMQGQDTHEKVAAVLGKTDAPWILARDMKKENDMLHEQIATLKAALISDRSKLLFLFKDRIFGMPETIIGSDRFKENAINKLAQEYPEIFREMKE